MVSHYAYLLLFRFISDRNYKISESLGSETYKSKDKSGIVVTRGLVDFSKYMKEKMEQRVWPIT